MAGQLVSKICGHVFVMQDAFMSQYFLDIYDRYKKSIAVATGESREKIFKKFVYSGMGKSFVVGINPTTNNQSFEMEFKPGKVHRSTKSHYTKAGNPRCSRNPTDLYKMRGSKYDENPAARRGALAYAIARVLGAAGRIVGMQSGNNIIYDFDTRILAHKMAVAARLATGGRYTK
jgi:hypothetical protein